MVWSRYQQPRTDPGQPGQDCCQKHTSEMDEAPGFASRGLVASPCWQVDYLPESVRISMTRRFSWRPSAVALSAIGAVRPLPIELSRAGSTPRDVR